MELLGDWDGAAFAERLLEVIDSGRRTATYKLALLLALIDLCGKLADESGRAPEVLYTRDIAESVVGQYWRQIAPFPTSGGARRLRQISARASAITVAIESFRRVADRHGFGSLHSARTGLPVEYDEMLDVVEETMANEPIARLQTIGSTPFIFIYELEWAARQKLPVNRLHRFGERGAPIRLLPGAGDQLIRLAPLIRPFVELHWVRMVARLNNVNTEEEALYEHLFGSERVPLPAGLKGELGELQEGRCFYCGDRLPASARADHFLPRVRCGIDAIENLVLADGPCNNDKRDHLAGPQLVQHWVERNRERAPDLVELATGYRWESDAPGVLSVARSIYGHLPSGPVPFWAGRKSIESGDALAALVALGMP